MNPIAQIRRRSPREMKSLSKNHKDPSKQNDHSWRIVRLTPQLQREERVYFEMNQGSWALMWDFKTAEYVWQKVH